MGEKKRALLIAGGGTLGTYTYKELLRLGHAVDVICLEDQVSDNPDLRFLKEYATVEYLEKLLTENRYDGIVNFLHYRTVEDYKPYHELLAANTDHLIFLSSYRVYADLQHPITENAPQLLDVTDDVPFLEEEDYALAKARCEKYIRANSQRTNWTFVRPVISFSKIRFDLFMNQISFEGVRNGEIYYLPEFARNLTAGLDWAGNSGKLIANLLFKDHAKGQAYTISSGQNLTWEAVAEAYTEVFGMDIRWVDEETYLNHYPQYRRGQYNYWRYAYDRCFDRLMDNSKVLEATGLTAGDFKSIREGIVIELARKKEEN